MSQKTDPNKVSVFGISVWGKEEETGKNWLRVYEMRERFRPQLVVLAKEIYEKRNTLIERKEAEANLLEFIDAHCTYIRRIRILYEVSP